MYPFSLAVVSAARVSVAVVLILGACLLPLGLGALMHSSWRRFTAVAVALSLASVGLMIVGIIELGR